jgi:hypothetical protein
MEIIKPDRLQSNIPVRAYDPQEAPGRMLEVSVVIDLEMRQHEGFIHVERQQAAHAMAKAILEEERFWQRGFKDARFYELRGRAIVMTPDELERFALDQYAKGREAGRFFMK